MLFKVSEALCWLTRPNTQRSQANHQHHLLEIVVYTQGVQEATVMWLKHISSIGKTLLREIKAGRFLPVRPSREKVWFERCEILTPKSSDPIPCQAYCSTPTTGTKITKLCTAAGIQYTLSHLSYMNGTLAFPTACGARKRQREGCGCFDKEATSGAF